MPPFWSSSEFMIAPYLMTFREFCYLRRPWCTIILSEHLLGTLQRPWMIGFLPWQEVQLRWRWLSEGSQQKEAKPHGTVEWWISPFELPKSPSDRVGLKETFSEFFSWNLILLLFHYGPSWRGDAQNSKMLDEMGHAVVPLCHLSL